MIPEIETKQPSEIKSYQESRLPELLNYLNNNSAFYREHFKNNNINIQSITKLEDLQQIPVTTKDDLQLRNNDFFCVDKSKVVDFITTSGTIGEPVTFAMTNHDLDRLAYNEQISFSCADTTKQDQQSNTKQC